MEIVWEPCFIIQAWFIQFLLFRSDVDLADVTGRLTVMCRGPLLFILSRFIYRGVMQEVIMLIQIAKKDTNNTGVDEITRSLFSYFTVRCSLGEFLFATDHAVAGARFL